MNTSAAWINDYLDPPASAEEQGELLTRAGFPLEASEPVVVSSGTDVRQDYEMTSNRGDCVCHLGLAREIAAISGRALKAPQPKPKATGPAAGDIAPVSNREHDLCPRYVARVVRGLKVGPSPAWLADRLIARGDIPRNNLVDLTNFVLFELGQPTHVFDLAKLRGPEIIIRRAHCGEPFLPIGEGAAEVKLTSDDLVIADAERAVAIAGVKGGALTAVTDATTDVLIEVATFSPVTVRNTSRRLGIASDSSYRFERGVHPAQLDYAGDRLVELILDLCGGELCEGIVEDGAPLPSPKQVTMRCDRCRQLIGVDIDDAAMLDALSRLEFQPTLAGGVITCTVPVHRLDIEREIDLIEEVSRMFGHDNIPLDDKLHIRVAPQQGAVMAKRAVDDALAGMGFLETVTHSLISDKAAEPFVASGAAVHRVDDERAKAEPVLRPSILPSLLRVLNLNRDSGVEDVKLYETAATFMQLNGEHREGRMLAMVVPARHAGGAERAMRELRGVIDRLVQIVLGPDARVEAEPSEARSWFSAGASLRLETSKRRSGETSNGAAAEVEVFGAFGLLSAQLTRVFGLDEPVLAAELALPGHYEQYPPETEARALPSYPAIERDVSAVVDERVRWSQVRDCVMKLNLADLEAIEFVTVFRGKPIAPSRKSLTLRLRFRAADRTLRHEDADQQVQEVVTALEQTFSATLRTVEHRQRP